jgi:hypothetical protein
MIDIGDNRDQLRGCVDDFEPKGPPARHRIAVCVTYINKVGAYLRRGSGENLNLRRKIAEERAWNHIA